MRLLSVVGFACAAFMVSTVAAADWHFEALSGDGKHALLRRLDPEMRSSWDVRVIDVDSGKVLDFADLEAMGQVPATTIGGQKAELSRLELTLASSDFARDLVQGAHIATPFPFGACGRLAAGGSAIAFDAGDWLYVADADGRIRSRLVDEAAYDPRFTPDGKWLFFRRAIGHRAGGMFAHYELYVSPADLSAPPRAVAGTAGMHDHFVVHPDGKTAFALASQPGTDTCIVSLGLKPPFATKKLACVDGGERVIESAISPRGRWAAVTTKKDAGWHLRVLNLATGKVVSDEPESAGLALRAISDSGVLVESGLKGALVADPSAATVRPLERPLDLGFRAFFRSDTELVYATADGSVATLDVTKE